MKNRWWVVIQFIMIIAAMGHLTMVKGSMSAYLVLFGAGLVALGLNFFINNHNAINAIFLKKTRERNWTLIFAGIMTLIVLGANYDLFVHPLEETNPVHKVLYGIIVFVTLALGAYSATYNIFKMIACHIGRISIYGKKGKMKSWEIFIFCMFSFMVVYSLIMTMGMYPGIVDADAMDQIAQAKTLVFNNEQPFYHTLIIKLCMDVANIIAPSNINFAVSVYSYLSIFIMALAFSLLIMTLVSVGVPKWCVGLIYAFYLVMPYHILFSFTMCNDTLFAAAVLIFTLYSYRVFKGIGRPIVNYIVVLFAGIAVCLLRNNGIAAVLLYGLILLLVYRLKAKRMVAVIAGTLFISIFLKFVIPAILGIEQPRLFTDTFGAFAYNEYMENKYYYFAVADNALGIRQVSKVPGFERLIYAYESIFVKLPILNLCISAGFNVWLCIVALFTAIIRKDRGAIMMSIPVLAIFTTLVFLTSGYAEFRYIYSIFTCLPLILVSAFFTIRKEA